MRNPELACDNCGDEVANGEGVMIGDDRVCSECAGMTNSLTKEWDAIARRNSELAVRVEARLNGLKAENAELWDFVETVAKANMAGFASTQAQEMVRNREVK